MLRGSRYWSPSSRQVWFRSLAVFLIACTVRGVLLVSWSDPLDGDPDAYRMLAETLDRFGTFGVASGDVTEVRPTAFRPPLYPWLLSWLVIDGSLSKPWVAGFHILLGGLTVVLTYRIVHQMTAWRVVSSAGARWPLAEERALLAAGIVMLDPILLAQSASVMTETMATALAAATWWFFNRRWSRSPRMQREAKNGLLWWLRRLALGTTLALAYLCRPTFLVWAVLILAGEIVLGWKRNRKTPQRLAWSVIVLMLPLALTMMSWIARNQRQLNAPVWATTHGGYTLLLANNPSFYAHIAEAPWRIGPLDRRWDATGFLAAHQRRYNADATDPGFWIKDWQEVPPEKAIVSEVEDDQYLQRAAKNTIQAAPVQFVWSCVVRLARLWSPVPHEGATLFRIAIGVFYCSLFWVAIWGIWKSRWYRDRLWWPGIALVITLSMVHAVYWSNLRMRAPATVAVAIAVALTVPRRLVLSESGMICYANKNEGVRKPSRRDRKSH